MLNKQVVKTLIQGGQWDEAKRVCSTLCQASPKDAEAWLLMGVIHDQLENVGEVEKCCRRVTALSPAAPVGHFNLGITLQKLGKFAEAAKSLRQAIKLNPHYAEAHYNLATVMHDKARVVEAVAHFREAIRLRPGMVKAHDALGQLFQAVGYLDQAVVSYQEAIRLHPDEPKLHFQLAMVLMDIGQNQEALKSLQRVLKLRPGNPQVYANMAKALEREGEFEAGYELLHPFLGGDEVDVALAYAPLSKHLGQQSHAMEMLERVLKCRISVEQCKSVHFALGKLHDEAKEYEHAFAYWRSANDMVKQKFDLKKNANLFADLKTVFSEERSARRPRASNQSALPVFIVGMPRSGTSLVEQILASHPEVYGAGELHDVGNLINMLPASVVSKGIYPHSLDAIKGVQVDEIAERHLARLAGFSTQASRVTDKMPHNFRHLGMIDMLFPKARIIHCLRDPVDTCLSIYSLPFSTNHLYASDLTQLGEYYRQYMDLMAHWKKVLRIPIFEVQYEDVVANQEEMTRKMIAFCGLEWDEHCLSYHESERAVTTPSYDQVRRPIYTKSVARWKNYERYLSPLIMALGQGKEVKP